MSTPESRWKARVAARMLNARIKEIKHWFGTDTGQLTLVGLFIIGCILAGVVEKM